MSNLPGFSIQSITSPTLSSNQSFPLAAVSNVLLTTALPPSTTLPETTLVPSLVLSQASPNTLSPFLFFLGFFLAKVPFANLGKVPLEKVGLFALNIACVCAPFITDDPCGKNVVVSLLGVIAILPLG